MPRATKKTVKGKTTKKAGKKGTKKVAKKAANKPLRIPKGKGIRRLKDPNAPKRALSAFMIFSNEIRDTVKVERPDLGFLEIATEIGRRWKEVPDNKRKRYEALAAKDKERYLAEKEHYVPDPAFLKAQAKRARKKDPLAPKRAMSAYIFYCNDFRESVKKMHPGMGVCEVASQLAAQWRELTDNKKVKYAKLAEQDKLRYQAEMEAYKASN